MQNARHPRTRGDMVGFMVSVFGILNVTNDSFSDGGRYIDQEAAVAHGLALVAAGADVVDVGAEATHPDAEEVSATAEIDRLRGVVERLQAASVSVSVDSNKPEVMAAMNRLSVAWLNDVGGFRSPAAVAAAAAGTARLVVMFARSGGGRARREQVAGSDVVRQAEEFFEQRIAALTAAGVDRARIVLDPGMGLFLGADAAPSLAMLRSLQALRRFELPLLVSVSRKSFLGQLTGRPTADRGAATLAAELWAAGHGVDWIRTHDPAALRDGLTVWAALDRQDPMTRSDPLAADSRASRAADAEALGTTGVGDVGPADRRAGGDRTGAAEQS